MADRHGRHDEYDQAGESHKHFSFPNSDSQHPSSASLPIKIRGLAEGENPIEISFDAAKLEYPEFIGRAELKGIVRKEGHRLDVTATVTVEGEFECTRCTDPFRRSISAELRLHFVPPRLEHNLGDPNVHTYDPMSSTVIDILPDVRDALILAIPMKNLCRPNCEGLCPTCGKNRNRERCDCSVTEEASGAWSALKGLSERLRAEEFKDPTRK